MRTPLSRGALRLALAAALASLALPAAAHADLVQGIPANVQGGFWEDASIGGDNHMGWGHSGSEAQPMDITFGATLSNSGPDPFTVCGYASTATGWLRSYQVSGTQCPDDAPSGTPDGWFEYVIANHSSSTAPGFKPAFNRYHLMDLQRFALVPLPVAAGGPQGAATAWDTDWGTCLAYDDPGMDCVQDENPALPLSTLLAAGDTKTTQEQDPAPDAERIAIPASAMGQFPDGLYQIVAIANPYGQYAGGSSVACTTISLSGVGSYAPAVTLVQAAPSTCYVPTDPPDALTGPGGRDPMAGAAPTTPACDLHEDDPSDPNDVPGHCWAEMPEADLPGDPLAPHPPARTAVNALTGDYVTPTSTVAVAQGGEATTLPPPDVGTTPPTPTPEGPPPTPLPAPPAVPRLPRVVTASEHPAAELSGRLARKDTRKAVRRTFGRHVSHLKVRCSLRGTTAATCRVAFRKAHATYRGHLRIHYATKGSEVRWRYRLKVRRHRPHHRASTITRGYRTGGTV